jgi:hypothetical protein
MKSIVEPNDDLQFERILKRYLRSTGRLVPETPGEVEHLLKLKPELCQPEGSFEDAMAILNRGYSGFKLTPGENKGQENTGDFTKAAARNAGKITDEIRRLMDSDREKSQNTSDND